MQVTEGVAAHPRYAGFRLDRVGQQVGQRPGARKLDVAVGVFFDILGQFGDYGCAFFVMYAFGNGDHATPKLVVNALYVGDERVHVEGSFGQVYKVRRIAAEGAGAGRGARQKAGVTAHDDADIDALQGHVVLIDAGEGAGHEAGGRGEPRRVIVNRQVVVDGFWDMDAGQVVIFLLRHLGQNL